MLWRSPQLSIVNGVYFASVVGLNIWGVQVTCMLGSLFRAVLLTTRTALVSLTAPAANTFFASCTFSKMPLAHVTQVVITVVYC